MIFGQRLIGAKTSRLETTKGSPNCKNEYNFSHICGMAYLHHISQSDFAEIAVAISLHKKYDYQVLCSRLKTVLAKGKCH